MPSDLIPPEHRAHPIRDALYAIEGLACRKTERVTTEKNVTEALRPFGPHGVDDLGLHTVMVRAEG